MAETEENQIDNKAFTGECNAVLMTVSDVLYAIGGKWKLMIIIAMARGNKRFTEIQRQVNGISARVLSSELKELELNGFIIKKVAVGSPA
jgi:DNA-binding HxlR family transcriptional regulator